MASLAPDNHEGTWSWGGGVAGKTHFPGGRTEAQATPSWEDVSSMVLMTGSGLGLVKASLLAPGPSARISNLWSPNSLL